MNSLENGKGESPIEAAAVSPGLAVLRIGLMKILHLDIESFVVDELIKHERNRPQIANEGGFCLNFLSNSFLLLVMQLPLYLVLGLLLLHYELLLKSTRFLNIKEKKSPFISFIVFGQFIIVCNYNRNQKNTSEGGLEPPTLRLEV